MRFVIGLTLALATVGPCRAASFSVDVPPPLVASPLPTGFAPKAVSLTRVAANIAPGTPWILESATSGPIPVPCVSFARTEVSVWKEANNRIEAIDTFDRVVREELQAVGFRAGGDPTNLFEEQQASDLQLGALITDLRVRTCTQESLGGTTLGGEASMNVEWQVYSVTAGKVVARISTRGGVILKQTKDAGAFGLVTSAFGDNVRRLAADPQFRELVSARVQAATPQPSAMTFAAASGPTPISNVVKSVVSIFAGDGMGSGVLISPDGYILTNHHVAGSSGQVRVRWADGTETIGDVLRADPRRDVALVRTTPKAAPLAIRPEAATLGETVFAIGTPLRKEYANTLTRGVVSGVRLLEGQSYIQSDVAIDHGNSGGPLVDEQGRIVALTVARFEADGVGHDINFFIPIEDALKALSLTPVAPAPTAKAAAH